MAHVHLPKPLHGWREFIGEVGIVFLGVIIALGAEQLIEGIHWRHQRELAEADMREELGNDDGVMAAALITRSRCVEQMLDRADAAILAGDRQRLTDAIDAVPPLDLEFDRMAWDAAVNSQVLSHGGSNATLQWAGPYAYVQPINTAFDKFRYDSAVVAASARGNGPIAVNEQRDALAASAGARAEWGRVARGSASFYDQIRALGIRANPTDVANLYKEDSSAMGDCAIDPRTVDLMSLRSPLASKVGASAR